MARGLRVRVLTTVLCLSQALLLTCANSLSLSFISEPMSAVQVPGGVVQLNCSVQPDSAQIRWLFRGKPLEPRPRNGIEFKAGSLSLHSLQPDNQGPYQCLAQSDAGIIVSRVAHVRIAAIEEFGKSHRRTVLVASGDTALLECQLPPSHPPALPRYRIRGQWLEESTDEYILLPSGNLQIVSAGPGHQGMYKCGAYNPVTRETRVEAHGTKVLVKDEPAGVVGVLQPSSPITLSVEQSKNITLECVLSGAPSSTAVRWIHEGREVSLGSRTRLLHRNLLLSDVTSDDSGTYYCSVHTTKGVLSSANYTVNVFEPSSVVAGLTDTVSTLHSSVQFTCQAKGKPSPNVTWLFNSNPVTQSARLQMSGSFLSISSIRFEDEGMYQCLLENTIGSAQSSGRLSVQSEPQLDSTALLPGDSLPSIHPYQSDEGEDVFLSLDGESEGEGVEDMGGLLPDRTSDQGTPEAPVIISPPQTHKPDIYDLEWKAVRDTDMPISAYFVKYRKVNENGNVVGSWHSVRVPGSENTLRLNDLEASSLYEVLMVARNTAGEGQPAMLTFRTGKERSSSSNRNPSKSPVIYVPEKTQEDKVTNTHYGVVIPDRAVPEAPDRPTISLASESSVYVAWIPRANGGSPITAFRVEYRKQGRTGEWMVAADNISPLKLSVEVRNLEPGSTYRFRVIAMNMYGESPASASSKSYQVSSANPAISNRPNTVPHIYFTDAVSDTAIMLRWTYSPATSNNTPIQGFYIYYRPTDSDNDSDYKKDIVDGNKKQWHTIGRLQPETSYDIKMQCFNDGGQSDFSNVMICETKARQHSGPPSHPPTPPEQELAEPPASAGTLLSAIVACVLAVMLVILFAFIGLCLCRNRQQNIIPKYDPPGYLYQPAEMNGHVLEYGGLPGSSHINGYGHSTPMLSQGCHHLHHKMANGLAIMNGSGGLYPANHSHGRDTPLSHATMDHEHTHPHHVHNGGALYTTLPQAETSDCMSCQNFCNNNRCYTKTNGTFSGGSVPLMHRMAPCQQDSLEMVPLSHISPQCFMNSSSSQPPPHTPSHNMPHPPDEDQGSAPPPSQNAPGKELPNSLEDREADSKTQAVEEPMVVDWEMLADLDCKEKVDFLSSSSLTGDLIQTTAQEV